MLLPFNIFEGELPPIVAGLATIATAVLLAFRYLKKEVGLGDSSSKETQSTQPVTITQRDLDEAVKLRTALEEVSTSKILASIKIVEEQIDNLSEKVEDLWRLRDIDGIPSSYSRRSMDQAVAHIQATLTNILATLDTIIRKNS